MHGLGTALIQELNGLPQLGAADDGVIHKQQVLVLDQLVHGNLLHLGDLVPVRLVGRHEAAAPGGGVLDEGPGKGRSAAVGVADGVGRTGVRHTADVVDRVIPAGFLVVVRHDRAVAVAHLLHVHAFVGGGGISVIAPEEGADLLFLSGSHQPGHLAGSQLNDFPGSQLADVFVTGLVESKGFKRHSVAVIPLADGHRQTAHPVPGRNDGALVRQDQNGGGAHNGLLGELNAFGKIALLVDQGAEQLRLVDLAAGHGIKVTAAEAEVLIDQRIRVVDHTGHADGVSAQVGADQQGLGIRVGNTADRGSAAHFLKNMFKLRPERGIADVVNFPLQTDLLVPRGHTGTAGAQMAVIVHTEKHIQHTVLLGRYSEKSTHIFNLRLNQFRIHNS